MDDPGPHPTPSAEQSPVPRPSAGPPVETFPDLLINPARREPPWVRALYMAGGILLILLGLVLWLTPIVTGAIPAYAVGLWMLGRSSSRIRAGINRVERRLPPRMRRLLRARRRKERPGSPPGFGGEAPGV